MHPHQSTTSLPPVDAMASMASISVTPRHLAIPQAEPVSVLLYTDSAEPSGMGEHMLSLGRVLQKTGRYRLYFACEASPAGEGFLARASQLGMQPLPLREHDDLFNFLVNRKIDVFHSHAGIGWEGHQGIWTARHAGVGAIIRTEHLPYLLTDPYQRQQHADLVACVDRLVCVSSEARDSFVQAGVVASKVSFVRNGITLQATAAGRDYRSALCRELGLPLDAMLCLTVGRMTEQKGYHYLLRAVKDVVAQVPGAYFLWAGSGSLEYGLREEAAALGLYKANDSDHGDRIRFLGRRSDVPALMAASDLFVLPSLFEGLPIAVLEAMSCGLPVVATDVTGTREAVQDGVSGRLVPPCNSPALSAAVTEALLSPRLTARWRREALALMRSYFTDERMAHEIECIYMDALDLKSNLTPGLGAALSSPLDLRAQFGGHAE